MMKAPSQLASAPVLFTAKSKPLLLNGVCCIASICLGICLFFANTGAWPCRIGLAVGGGLALGVASRASFTWLMRAIGLVRHLISERRPALFRGALGGGVIGVTLGWILRDSSAGLLPTMQIAGFFGMAMSVVGALVLAQSELPIDPKPRDTWALSPALLAAFFLTLFLLTAPRVIVTAQNDGSWSAVLNYAHAKGLQFGTQIIFTYGPLGFLTTPWFSADAEWLRFCSDLVVTFTAAAGVCLLARRLPVTWRYLVVGAFVLFSPNIHRNAAPHAGVDLLLWQGLFSWGLLCLLETQPRLVMCVCVFIGLAIFSALAKSVFLAISVLSIGTVACCLSIRGRQRIGIGMVVGFFLGFITLWLAVRQELSHLGDFLRHAWLVAGSYEAMAHSAPDGAERWGVITAVLALTAAIKSSLLAFNKEKRCARWFQACLLIWLVILVFIAWKQGFVRADGYHIEAFVGFALLAAIIMSGIEAAATTRVGWVWPLAVVCCLAAIGTLQRAFFPGYLSDGVIHSFNLVAENAQVLATPTRHWQAMAGAEETVRRAGQLKRLKPIVGKASVDVFGSQQVIALFNGLDYRPRPVFESYAAYSRPLMELNDQFYASEHRPDFVLFKLDPLGHRFPPLEDALVLSDLLINYQPVATEQGLLLLRSARSAHPELRLLREGIVGDSERILLNDYGDADLWIELALEPTAEGRLASLLYKAAGLGLRVWKPGPLAGGAAFEAPASMLAAGFIASPLLLNTQDVADLYSGIKMIRPSAYAVELAAGTQRCWQSRIHYRIYRIESKLGRCGWAPPTE